MEQITRVQIQESLDTYVKTYITDAEHHNLFSTWAEIYAPKGIRIVANVDKVGSSVGVTSEYDNEFYIVI